MRMQPNNNNNNYVYKMYNSYFKLMPIKNLIAVPNFFLNDDEKIYKVKIVKQLDLSIINYLCKATVPLQIMHFFLCP